MRPEISFDRTGGREAAPRMRHLHAVLCRLCVAAAVPLALPLPAFAAELSDAFVEKTLGVQGVQHAPSKYNKLDLVYRDGSGAQLFTLRLTGPQAFDAMKSASSDKIEPVTGVGDDAFAYKKLGGLCARTVKTAACLSSLPLSGRPPLTRDQLATLIRAAL